MACPYFAGIRSGRRSSESGNGSGHLSIRNENDLTYGSILQLDTLLSCQKPKSGGGVTSPAHDELLFIITHQAFELWFKQILYEVNSVREVFMAECLEERSSLHVMSLLNRVVTILKLCTDQFNILETMTPQDFLDFREHLGSASGFQSFQFRMLEIRLGVVNDMRVEYNRRHFIHVFFGKERELLEKAMSEPSLLDLVNEWLSRTPGLESQTFDFWGRFKVSVKAMLDEMKVTADDEIDQEEKAWKLKEWESRKESFEMLFDEKSHNDLYKKSERRLSHAALQGALMIFFYRDEPRFHLPFQVLQHLMDIDSQLMKFRYNHSSMVQRMVGSKVGTGRSSGYLYLRSTCSDRYKIFLDLFNMATYLVPRDRIPPLSVQMRRSLSVLDIDHLHSPQEGQDSGLATGSVFSDLTNATEELVEEDKTTRRPKLETVV